MESFRSFQRLMLVSAWAGKALKSAPSHWDLWMLSNWSYTDGGNDYKSLTHAGYAIWLLFNLCLETIFLNLTTNFSWRNESACRRECGRIIFVESRSRKRNSKGRLIFNPELFSSVGSTVGLCLSVQGQRSVRQVRLLHRHPGPTNTPHPRTNPLTFL